MTIDPEITFDPDTMTLRFSYEANAGLVHVSCDKTVDLQPMAKAIEQRIMEKLEQQQEVA